MPATPPRMSVERYDVLDFQCDVLILKYAQGWHGADLTVARQLGIARGWDAPAPGQYKSVQSHGKLACPQILFQGVPTLRQIRYSTIREFSKNSIESVNQAHPNVRHIALTMHGVNFGLDEKEAFLAQLGGILDALRDSSILPQLQHISFVEINLARATRIAALLKQNYSSHEGKVDGAGSGEVARAGQMEEKPHIFVAMPFNDEMEDVYVFGIQNPVQAAGFLCERIDMAVFTGDIVEQIKSRIQSSYVVIADLTGANANVYLEVGYSWGINKKTVLVCKNVEELKFDVKGQRCIIYSNINDLNKKLTAELQTIRH